MIKALILLSLIVLLGVVTSWFVAGQLIAPLPSQTDYSSYSIPVDEFTIPSHSGIRLSGWHVVADSKKGVVVLLHGIRSSKTSMLARAKLLYEAGYSSVLVDLRAHGESEGDRITVGYLERYDALAAIKYAKENHPGEPVGLIGVSLGGASALLGSPLDVNALILESVFPDIANAVHNRVATRLGPFSWIPAEILLMQLQPRLGVSISELRPIDKIAEIGCPVFIISGKSDLNTTVEETMLLFSTAREPKDLWLIDEAAHIDLLDKAPEEYASRVINFFDLHMQ